MAAINNRLYIFFLKWKDPLENNEIIGIKYAKKKLSCLAKLKSISKKKIPLMERISKYVNFFFKAWLLMNNALLTRKNLITANLGKVKTK